MNPETLANRVWQHIWISTGKEPEKCLYNVVEIFIFKFLSDLEILTDTYSFNNIYELSKTDKDASLSMYASMVRKKIKEMFPKSDGGDGTTIINGTIFVTETGEANLKNALLFQTVLKEFALFGEEERSFKNIDKEFKTRLYENFLRQSAGVKALGQYFTPRNVVKSVINMLNVDSIPEDAKICDPFCGVGGFLLELVNESPKIKNQFIPENGKIEPKTELIGYDKGSDEKEDERTIILAKANALIYFSDLISKYKDATEQFSKEVFNKIFHLERTNLGTLGITKHKNQFDLILTNPPYVTSGVTSIKKEIIDKGIEIYRSNGNGLEGLAVEWIIDALKPGGSAFVVLPDGIMSRQGDKKLRDNILKKCCVNAIISLPSRTFYSTPKKTYILSITKKTEQRKQVKPFFSYLVSEIGETKDAKRFKKDANDLLDMSILYKQFSATPNEFKTDNLRCKIQNISRLENGHWLIDRDWSNDDKKELGVEEETTEMTELEFNDLIKEINKTISDFVKV
ncbi:MAG: N-6 DNA methylase [Alphaproteobacteria bacterium]|nr:N-6 DNA methylase [Alphaproteobacteria bacterium]